MDEFAASDTDRALMIMVGFSDVDQTSAQDRRAAGDKRPRPTPPNALRNMPVSVQQLEDRVRVLERIVTDRGYDIATQIEALRDQRRVDEADSGVSIDSLRKERA